jgi:hypothetical protein
LQFKTGGAPVMSACRERHVSLNKSNACARSGLLLAAACCFECWMHRNAAETAPCSAGASASACMTGCIVEGRRLQEVEGAVVRPEVRNGGAVHVASAADASRRNEGDDRLRCRLPEGGVTRASSRITAHGEYLLQLHAAQRDRAAATIASTCVPALPPPAGGS